MIGALGQLPTVFDDTRSSFSEDSLCALIESGPPPLAGMLEVVEMVRGHIKSGYEGNSGYG